MKGIILSEFIEFLENELGDDRAQKIIDQSELPSEGAYSRVGLYDYHELIRLLTETVSETQTAADVLLEQFSEHLFSIFKRDYGLFFDGVNNAAEMLMQIDNHIHVEVQKLYPDAELPKFEYTHEGSLLTLEYTSPRALAAVAKSLVSACLKFFGNEEELVSYEISEDQKSATFVISTVKTG